MNAHEYMKHFLTKTLLEAIELPTSFLLRSSLALLHLQQYTSKEMKHEITKALTSPISKLWDEATSTLITTIQEYVASHFPSFVEPYLKQGKPIPTTELKQAVNIGPRDPKDTDPATKEKLLEFYNFTTEGITFPPEHNDLFNILQFTSLAHIMNWHELSLNPHDIEAATQWQTLPTIRHTMQLLEPTDSPEMPTTRKGIKPPKEQTVSGIPGTKKVSSGLTDSTLDPNATEQALQYATTDSDDTTKKLILSVVKHAAKYNPQIRKLLQTYTPTYI